MLIGREAERRAIERLVAGARVGSSGVLLITGEPGIGKTALVTEAAALAADLRVLRARGTEAEREIPFGGLLQLLRPALGELDRIPAPQREALAAALALSTTSDSPHERFVVGAATLSLVCRYAEGAPVAMLVDDAQLLDLPSAEALLFAARRLLADPIVLVIAARSGEPHPLAEADLPQLRLGGVGLAAAQQLVGELPVDLVASLHRTVAGNPLALLELARDPEQLQRVPPGVPVPVPALLANAFAARANKLSEAAQTALLVASVEDGELGVVARACADLGVDVAVLAEAEQASLVMLRDGRVEFRHPLVRSAIYASAEPANRRAVHLAVAHAVQDDDRRAWHLSETVLGSDDAVAAALELAGNHAVDRGAHAVAATAFERAARLTGTAGARALRLVAAGEAAWFAGLPERADGLLDEAVALDPPPRVRSHADELRGDIALKTGSPAKSSRHPRRCGSRHRGSRNRGRPTRRPGQCLLPARRRNDSPESLRRPGEAAGRGRAPRDPRDRSPGQRGRQGAQWERWHRGDPASHRARAVGRPRPRPAQADLDDACADVPARDRYGAGTDRSGDAGAP